VGLAYLKGSGWQSGDPACLWIPGLTGSGGHDQAEQRLCVWVLALQALGAQPCKVNIVQCCAGFGGMANKAEIMQDWGT
jgi:hypothetical protein